MPPPGSFHRLILFLIGMLGLGVVNEFIMRGMSNEQRMVTSLLIALPLLTIDAWLERRRRTGARERDVPPG
jgi:hypothetical protein